MIQYIEKGVGLFDFLSENGVELFQLDANWVYRGNKTVEEVNELISSYNPWPIEKRKKMVEINKDFASAVDQLVSGTTSDERNSWAIQEREAAEWIKDNNASIPALNVLAASRGIPVDILAEKVLEKAALYKQYYFTFQGMRDRAEDLVKSLPNSGSIERLHELQNIYFGV